MFLSLPPGAGWLFLIFWVLAETSFPQKGLPGYTTSCPSSLHNKSPSSMNVPSVCNYGLLRVFPYWSLFPPHWSLAIGGIWSLLVTAAPQCLAQCLVQSNLSKYICWMNEAKYKCKQVIFPGVQLITCPYLKSFLGSSTAQWSASFTARHWRGPLCEPRDPFQALECTTKLLCPGKPHFHLPCQQTALLPPGKGTQLSPGLRTPSLPDKMLPTI